MNKIKYKAPINYFGGKHKLRGWINSYIPEHTIYVEPFGGAASIMCEKAPSNTEVYNDIDNTLVTLFRVIKNKEQNEELVKFLNNTLYSRDEFIYALDILNNTKNYSAIEIAWAVVVKHKQGFGGRGKTSGDWGFSINSGGCRSCAFSKTGEIINQLYERFKNVYIENKSFEYIINRYQSSDTLIYADPPYFSSTRKSGKYDNELTDEQHFSLIELLMNTPSMVILSGYNNVMYESMLEWAGGWLRIDKKVTAHSAGRVKGSNLKGSEAPQRIESIWLNPKTIQKLNIKS